MASPARAAVLDRLRDTIEALEKRAPLSGTLPHTPAPRAPQAAAGFPFPRLPEDALHEVWVPGFREAAPGLAFALGHAAARRSAERPAILWIQLAHETQETGLPYGPGLAALGLTAQDLVLIRVQTVPELLWAIEEAAACRAVAAVIADVLVTPKALDFTASRRLALRTGASGVPVFTLRYGAGREASAARTRWRIAPAPSARHPYDANAPGAPRWQAALEKAPHGQSGLWRLGWTDTGFTAFPETPNPRSTHVPSGTGPSLRPLSRPAASGAHLSALGDRLSEAS